MAAMTVESNDDGVYMQTTASSGNLYQQPQASLQNDETSSSNPPPIDIPEEECWLFKPPQGTPFSPTAGSCLAWVREIFDSPSSFLFHRKWDLLHRLEVILATEPAKRLPNLGGSVPALNTAATPSNGLPSLSRGISGQNFGPGSSATFVRPKRYTSDVIPPSFQQQQQPSQHGRQRSSPVPFNGSSDDLQNVADLQSIARKQADDLKAEVAAISAHQQASRSGGSQQSLNRSGPESPYTSQPRLNTVSPSPTPSDIAKQQMAALRLSLDSQRPNLLHRSDENLMVGGEASITSPEPNEAIFGPGMPQAVIVGRPSIGKPGSRLPGPLPARRGPRFPSAEALPSFGWSADGGGLRRSSQEQLSAPRRLSGAQQRMGLQPQQ